MLKWRITQSAKKDVTSGSSIGVAPERVVCTGIERLKNGL